MTAEMLEAETTMRRRNAAMSFLAQPQSASAQHIRQNPKP
jgi:hypothetical protein